MEIEIRVYSTALDWNNHHPALVKRVEYGSICFPFEKVIDSFKCLFGRDCVIDIIVL